MLRPRTFMIRLFRYGSFPLMLVGFNGVLIALAGAGAPLWQPFMVLFAAIGCMFIIERIIPYAPEWNVGHHDGLRDLLHFVVNTVCNHLGVFLLPVLAALAPFPDAWPLRWPFWAQVLLAVLVLDFGVSAAHHASHRWPLLWRFHAVHHSARRLYGFNGLMKHPVHQAIETMSGIAPLLLIGIPPAVATAMAFCVAIQLLLQHSNADYRSGPLKYFFANAEVHRFHHRSGGAGDVNFGLFTALWDRLAGTFHYAPGQAPHASGQIGLQGDDRYPDRYLAQLLQPFRELLARNTTVATP